MAKQTIIYLKEKYETGDVPIEANYADWLDSFVHIDNEKRGTLDGVVEELYERDILHNATTWFDLLVDGIKLVVPAKTSWNYNILVCGGTANMLKYWQYELTGAIVRTNGASITVDGEMRQVRGETESGFDAQVTTDIIDYALQVQVKDAAGAGDQVKWVAYLQAISLTN